MVKLVRSNVKKGFQSWTSRVWLHKKKNMRIFSPKNAWQFCVNVPLLGMVSLSDPFKGKVKWPPTMGSKGHELSQVVMEVLVIWNWDTKTPRFSPICRSLWYHLWHGFRKCIGDKKLQPRNVGKNWWNFWLKKGPFGHTKPPHRVARLSTSAIFCRSLVIRG